VLRSPASSTAGTSSPAGFPIGPFTIYRLIKSIREADTPMAALVLPMFDPRAFGVVLHTQG
jgi:hypothetical protein